MRPLQLVLPLILACSAALAQEPPAEPAPASSEAVPVAVQEAPPAPLQVVENRIGKGQPAQAGNVVAVHYTGWLYDAKAKRQRGKRFDSSYDRKSPLSFELGGGRVIKGWEQGIAGMAVGGKRTLIIPAELAYGKRGAGNGLIPPDATLLFDVELVGVK